MLFNNINVNSQILYAEMKWDEMEKAESTKTQLNNVKHAFKAKLWSAVEIRTPFSINIIYRPLQFLILLLILGVRLHFSNSSVFLGPFINPNTHLKALLLI